MLKYVLATMAALASIASCQAPQEPASLQDSGVAQADAAGGSSNAGAETFDAGGALVGTEAMKTALKQCLVTKKFYDRQSATCTAFSLANVACKADKIKGIMNQEQIRGFDSLLADASKLKDFLLDQCLDCSDPSSNLFCKGPTNQTSKGVRLFFVKEGGGQISIQTLYIKTQ